MKNTNTFETMTLRACALSSVAVMLAACGGGGGSSSTAPQTIPTQQTAVPTDGTTNQGTSSAQMPTAPAAVNGGRVFFTDQDGSQVLLGAGNSNYTPGSVKAQSFAKVASLRAGCSFPAQFQNSQLDTAAQGHADYLRLNRLGPVHQQVRGNAGFTGERSFDVPGSLGRISAAGYQVAGGTFSLETIAGTFSADPLSQVKALLTVPYHSFVFFAPASEVGLGEASFRADNGFTLSNLVFNYATHTAGPAEIALTSAPQSWPCNGTDNVPFENIGSEIPQPIVNGRPRALTSPDDKIGIPITVAGNFGDVITLATATLTPVNGAGSTNNFSGGTLDIARQRTSSSRDDATNLTLMQSSTDPNLTALKFMGIVQPAAKLEPSTVYEVFVTGTIKRGTAAAQNFNKTFRFRTGSVGGPF